MDLQILVTALLVAACSARVVWMLMPATLRARCCDGLGFKPAASPGGCSGCSGCGGGTAAAAPGAPQVVKIVRRPGA